MVGRSRKMENKFKNQPDDADFNISSDDIRNELDVKLEKICPRSQKMILSQLLMKVERIDFHAIVEKENKGQLQVSHTHVIVVEEVLRLAKENNWGLCQNNGVTYLFNGAHWISLAHDDLKDFLGKAAEKLGIEKLKARHFHYRDHLLKQFLASSNLPSPEPDNQKVLVNLKNGTFEISLIEQKIREHRAEDFLKYQLSFSYDPESEAPKFQAYLNKVLSDKSAQDLLAEYIGYLFIKQSNLKLEKVLILYGSGANGKSVFFEIINALVGKENVSSFSLQSLTDSTGYFRAKIADKLVNYASEINGKLEASLFKQLASGERVEARLPYGNPFDMEDYAKLIFNCNELPTEVEHTEAFFRRFLVVPFLATIPEKEQDKELAKKIICDELPGVFNWVLQGLERLLRQKAFTESELVHAQLEEYKKLSDNVKLFLEECRYSTSISCLLIKELYNEYTQYCAEEGYKPLGKKNFIKRLKNAGVAVDRKNVGYIAYLERPSR